MAWSVVRVAFFPIFVPVAAGFVFAIFFDLTLSDAVEIAWDYGAARRAASAV